MKKVSIIILNWNTKELIKECVKTVRKNTAYPFELILVDNGSVDGSVEIIKSLKDENTKVIFLDKNHGFAGGNNKGLEAATGDMVCLLNSDAFVTKGWLHSMVKCMEKTGAGMVGPWTNRAKGAQRRKGKHRLIPKFFRRPKVVEYLSFFCVLIDKAVIEKIGSLDESFGLGTYEDDDFCHRALDSDIELVIDSKSWVWHEAHATMKANNIDESILLEKNAFILSRKMGDK